MPLRQGIDLDRRFTVGKIDVSDCSSDLRHTLGMGLPALSVTAAQEACRFVAVDA